MTRPKELLRDYNKPDSTMLEQGQGMYDNLVENLPVFTAKYPTIDAAFALGFKTAIDDANDVPHDRVLVEEISDDAARMEGFVADGKSAFMNLIIIARMAFPNNPTMINRFGLPEYEEYSSIHTKFPIILDQAHDLANDPINKPLLISKGMTVASIANIATVSENIKAENKLLFSEKKKRIPNTQERIKKYNAVWEFMVQISECSKMLFSDNWAMYHMFLLYPEKEPAVIPPVPPIPPTE